MNKKSICTRVVIYLVLVGVIIVAIRAKQVKVIHEREKKVISPISEWKEKGKPITVLVLKKHDFHNFTKVTAKRIGNTTQFVSHLSQETRGNLKIGQEVYYEANTKKLCGTIIKINTERDLNTGMFEVVMDLKEASQALNHREIVFIKTSTLKDVIQVPHNAIDLVGEDILVRLYDNGRVSIKKVTIGQVDRESIVIRDGLEEGDAIIVEGKSLVHEGDFVAIKKEVVQ